MRHVDREIHGVGELLTFLTEDVGDSREPLWFRGQADSDWALDPKLLRDNDLPPESHLINKFRQNASYIIQQPRQVSSPQTASNEFEWLFLMQHHGIPTRLLDWSESVLAGLYFACDIEHECDGTLWVLAPCELNRVSNYRPEYPFEIPSFEDDELANYSPRTIAAETKSRLLPMAAIAVRNSPRMHAQQGVFTVAHRGESKINEMGEVDQFLWRYTIPTNVKPAIINELRVLGFGKFQLFPELTSIAESMI